MHVQEVDGHLDYAAFWKGREDTKSAGRAWWELFQGLADTYPCPPCKPGARAVAYGYEDVISIHIGKAVKHPEQLEALFKIVSSAWHQYRNHGAGRRPAHTMEAEHPG